MNLMFHIIIQQIKFNEKINLHVSKCIMINLVILSIKKPKYNLTFFSQEGFPNTFGI